MESEPRRPRLPALTSLRFFAALAVVFFHLHALHITSGQAWFHKLSSLGYVGVSFFFVLSGFILVYTYAGHTWKASVFWRARFARIYPASLCSRLGTQSCGIPILVLLGNASYSLYLLHATFMFVFFYAGQQLQVKTPVGIVLYLALILGVSVLIYKFLEEPARRCLNPRRA